MLETHYPNDMRNMLSSTIAVVELTHTGGLDAIATNRVVNELLKLILKTDGSGKESESNSKPTPEAEMQSDDPGIAAPAAINERESRVTQHPKMRCNRLVLLFRSTDVKEFCLRFQMIFF